MAAFNIFGKIFTTSEHGKDHVDAVLSEHGIEVEWRDETTPQPGEIRDKDGVLYRTVVMDDQGNIISGQWQYDIW